jgi:hypothetical protein
VTCKPTTKFSAVCYSVIAALLLSSSCLCAAEDTNPPAADSGNKIYKKVGPDGEVIYTDKPSAGSQEVQVPTGSGYKPVAPPAGFSPYQAPAKTPAKPAIENTVSITSPKNDTSFWSGDGELLVSVSLASGLGPGQQLEYVIDGETMYTGTETSHTFSNIFRGTHVVTVRITDGTGNSVASQPVTFTMQRPTVKRN